MGINSKLAAMFAALLGGPHGPKKPGQFIPGMPDRTPPPRGGRPSRRALRRAQTRHCDAYPLGVQVKGEQALAVLDLALGLRLGPVQVGRGQVERRPLMLVLMGNGVSNKMLRKRRNALAKALRRGRRVKVLLQANAALELCGAAEYFQDKDRGPLTLAELAAPARRQRAKAARALAQAMTRKERRARIRRRAQRLAEAAHLASLGAPSRRPARRPPMDDPRADGPKRLVLYHGPECRDGFTPAWCAWLRFGDAGAEYRATRYVQDTLGSPLPDDFADFDEVYILDYAWGPDALLAAMRSGQQVVVLDHHAHALDAWSGPEVSEKVWAKWPDLDRVVDEWDAGVAITEVRLRDGTRPLQVRVDTHQSGAVLAARFFRHQATDLWFEWDRDLEQGEVPLVAAYAQDRDLWRWELPHSREVAAVMGHTEPTFDAWSALNLSLATEHAPVQRRGAGILEGQRAAVALATRRPLLCTFLGHRAALVNATSYVSECGEALVQAHPDVELAVLWGVDHGKGLVFFSLRGRADQSGPHLGHLVEAVGGGGHHSAAGLKVPLHVGLQVVGAAQLGAVRVEDFTLPSREEAA